MILFIFGDDAYTSQKYLSKLKSEFAKKYDALNSVVIDGQTLKELQEVENECITQGFFAEKKMIIISGFLGKNKKNTLKNAYTEFLKKSTLKDDKDTILIHFESDSEFDKRQSLYKHLQKNARITENKAPNDKNIEQWFQNTCTAQSYTLDNDAKTAFIECFHTPNYYRLHLEWNKLQFYLQSQNKTHIETEDIKKVISQDVAGDIFDFTKYIAQKDIQKALQTLQKLFTMGESEFSILGMIAYQMRTLLSIRLLSDKGLDPKAIASTAKLHPFVVMKNKKLADNFSFEGLLDLYTKLTQTEYTLKTRQTDNQMMMVGLVREFTVTLP